MKINELIKKSSLQRGLEPGRQSGTWGGTWVSRISESLPKEHVSGNQTHSASLGNRVGLHYSRFPLFARANSVNNQWFTDSIRVQNRYFRVRIREDGLARLVTAAIDLQFTLPLDRDEAKSVAAEAVA